MHAEAMTYTRQTLGYPRPPFAGDRTAPAGSPCPGDVEVPGGVFVLGATPDLPFVFDNEKWGHPVTVAPYRIARAPVTNAEFAAFVDEGGYDDSRWWSDDGWRWRKTEGGPHPVYWQRESSGRWLERTFDQWLPLQAELPVIHVNWYEAEAYCRWAGRRLPTEPEWEMAAAVDAADGATPEASKRGYPWGDAPPDATHGNLDWAAGGRLPVDALPAGDSAVGCRQMIGNVWEWTGRRLPSLSRLRPGPLQGVFGALVRRPQGAARRLLGHPLPSDPQHVAELLHTGAAGRAGRLPHVCAGLAEPWIQAAARLEGRLGTRELRNRQNRPRNSCGTHPAYGQPHLGWQVGANPSSVGTSGHGPGPVRA